MLQKSAVQVSISSAVVPYIYSIFTKNQYARKPQKIHKNKYSVSYKQPVTSKSMSKKKSKKILTSSIVSKQRRSELDERGGGGQGEKWARGEGPDRGLVVVVLNTLRASLRPLRGAIVYIDSVTVRELFVFSDGKILPTGHYHHLCPSAAHCERRVRMGRCVRGQSRGALGAGYSSSPCAVQPMLLTRGLKVESFATPTITTTLPPSKPFATPFFSSPPPNTPFFKLL